LEVARESIRVSDTLRTLRAQGVHIRLNYRGDQGKKWISGIVLGFGSVHLKVPKCENFHRTDFLYFYTINKKFKILIFRGSFGGFFFENFVLAQAECAQFFIYFLS
jgi:hypothetical protein